MGLMSRAGLLCFALVLASAWASAAAGAGGMVKEPLKVETAAGPRDFVVEVAATSEDQATGLMYRREMAADAGMLFVYPAGSRVTMWMKNTLIPLDMVFIGPAGRITHIVERTVPMSNELIGSNGPVRAVLELNAGTASRLGIKVGDQVRHPAFR
ncbi:MAG: DUF192 domain-containing protein [Alphaproteobacteria bacterium]